MGVHLEPLSVVQLIHSFRMKNVFTIFMVFLAYLALYINSFAD